MIDIIGLILLGALLGWFLGRQGRASSNTCGVSYCDSRSDPRCAAGNCTNHCQSITHCDERCLDAWSHSDAAKDIATQVMAKARAK